MNFDPLSFAIGKHRDSGPVRDVVSYLIGQTAGTAGEIWQTLTNVAVASFTSVSRSLRNLVIDVTPVQAGSGDPSPTNVRPISGWKGSNIVVSPTLDAADGTTYPVSWQAEADTVYGGTLTDNGDGMWTLTVTHYGYTLPAFTEISDAVVGTLKCVFATPGSPVRPRPRVIPACAEALIPTTWGDRGAAWSVTTNNSYQLVIFVPTDATVEEVNAAIAGTKVVYPLLQGAEQTYTLTAESVQALIGRNNVFANTGNINTITFRTH